MRAAAVVVVTTLQAGLVEQGAGVRAVILAQLARRARSILVVAVVPQALRLRRLVALEEVVS